MIFTVGLLSEFQGPFFGTANRRGARGPASLGRSPSGPRSRTLTGPDGLKGGKQRSELAGGGKQPSQPKRNLVKGTNGGRLVFFFYPVLFGGQSIFQVMGNHSQPLAKKTKRCL